MPSVEGKHLLLKLLFHRWNVIIHLEHDINVLIVDWLLKDLLLRVSLHRILLCHAFVCEADTRVSFTLLALFILEFILGATHEEMFTAIKRKRLHHTLILLLFRVDKGV